VPSLHELQSAFVGELFAEQSTAVEHSVADDIFSARELLRVYRNNLFSSLADALSSAYPVMKKLVGDGFFAYMAHEYIQQHPSRSGNLHDFGSRMSAFIVAFEPASTLPYLADIARLEWARQTAYHAADRRSLDLAKLQEVPPEHYERLRFRLHPSVGLVASRYPILQIWQANQEDSPPDGHVNLDSGSERVLLIRPGSEIVMRALGAAEFALVSDLFDGKPLGEAVNAGLSMEAQFDLGSALQRQVALGSLVALDF